MRRTVCASAVSRGGHFTVAFCWHLLLCFGSEGTQTYRVFTEEPFKLSFFPTLFKDPFINK